MRTKRKPGSRPSPAGRRARAGDGKPPDDEPLLQIMVKAAKAAHLVASSLGALNVHLYLASQKTTSAEGRRHIEDALRAVRSSGEQLEQVSQLLADGKAAMSRRSRRKIHEETNQK